MTYPSALRDEAEWQRLRGWLAQHVPDLDLSAADVQPLTSGASNELFVVDDSVRAIVLRKPARSPQDQAASNRIMSREFRLLSALQVTEVPHPRVLALCEDPAVLGAHFYAMEWVDGFAAVGLFPGVFATSPEARREWALAVVDVLADLGVIDWQGLGLSDFGRPEGFLGRQVGRWMKHFEANRTREVPGLDKAARWLDGHWPRSSAPGIMHGDYQPHNVLIAPGLPVRVAAVLDWEQATIGDPLLDLGLLLAGWADPGEPERFASYMSPRDGLPTRAELVQRYTERSGRDATDVRYYEILALFKLACVLEGNYRLWVTGASTRDVHRRTGDIVLGLGAQVAEAVATVS